MTILMLALALVGCGRKSDPATLFGVTLGESLESAPAGKYLSDPDKGIQLYTYDYRPPFHGLYWSFDYYVIENRIVKTTAHTCCKKEADAQKNFNFLKKIATDNFNGFPETVVQDTSSCYEKIVHAEKPYIVLCSCTVQGESYDLYISVRYDDPCLK